VVGMTLGSLTTGSSGILGHVGIPGLAPFVATGLLLAGMGTAFGAFVLREAGDPRRRAMVIGLGIVAGGCLVVGTLVPLIIHATPTFTRPSTTARLAILSPRSGEMIQGDPAVVQVRLGLEGGKVVPVSSLHLVPHEGHIHLYLDASLVSMTGLDARITAPPGPHTLSAEFVAVDHGPFQPRVLAMVNFSVRP
jgi:hypothetical protein